jgi:hypothetical protein
MTRSACAVQLGDLQAGEKVEGIGFACFNEAGRPTPSSDKEVNGRVMCGWMRKARKAVLTESGALTMLPPLTVPTEVRRAVAKPI